MAIIQPLRHDVEHPKRVKKHSLGLRLWHWLSLLVISGSLITVLINSTLITRENTVPLVTSELAQQHVTVNAEQARSVGHALEDQVWGIHIYFGYALAALLLFRIVLEFFQLADQKFIRKMKVAYAQYRLTKQNRMARHELAVKSLYSLFYLLLITMAITGLFLAFEDFFEPFKSIRHDVKEVHGFCMYLILGFIALHVGGVLLAEGRKEKGLVSDMINGGGE